MNTIYLPQFTSSLFIGDNYCVISSTELKTRYSDIGICVGVSREDSAYLIEEYHQLILLIWTKIMLG